MPEHRHALRLIVTTLICGLALVPFARTEGAALLRSEPAQNIMPGPADTQVVGDRVVYTIDTDPGNDYPPSRDLFVTDGTITGTHHLVQRSPHVFPISEQLLRSNGDLIYLGRSSDLGVRLWRTNTTTGETIALSQSLRTDDPRSPLLEVNGIFFFIAYTGEYHGEWWRSDGTPEGTFMLKDLLHPGSRLDSPTHVYAVLGDTLYFVPDAQDSRVWQTDGTTEGTVPVEGLDVGVWAQIERVGNDLYLLNSSTTAPKLRIWRIDGATGTPERVEWFVGRPGRPHVSQFTAFGDRLAFVTYSSMTNMLWITDGTTAGSYPLATFTGFDTSTTFRPWVFAEMGGILYFASGNDNDHELWRTDGTEAGTWRIRDIRPGVAASKPQALHVVGDRLFFSADDGTLGRELWVSDGTSEGTVLLQDINPGSEGSDPARFVWTRNRLFFAATQPNLRRELMSISYEIVLHPRAYLPLVMR